MYIIRRNVSINRNMIGKRGEEYTTIMYKYTIFSLTFIYLEELKFPIFMLPHQVKLLFLTTVIHHHLLAY